ncbi:MAG TPA: amidohydrolase family protein [Chloroflexota bacterium]|jgi:predicted TIM-barrel fold metal-dependent hydrolase
MLDFQLISADTHVAEHPDAWARVQREYGDRAPHVVQDPPGLSEGLWIITDGLEPMRSAYFALGHIVAKPEGISNMEQWEDPRAFQRRMLEFNETFRYEDYPGGWEPTAHLRDMDRDGVEAEIIFSSPTRFNYSQTDAPFQRAIFRSYNEWIMEFASAAPRRLFPMPLISILDVDAAVADMREYVKRGCRSVHIPTQILGSGYFEPRYEPLWATAAELDVPLTVHSNSSQNLSRHHVDQGAREFDPRKQIMRTTRQVPAVEFVSNLIFSGVFDRYPTLQVVCSEFECHWVAGLVQRVDYNLGRESTYDPERNLNKRLPSEYLRENVSFSFEDDRAGMLTVPLYGEDNLMWGNDYPHHQTTWPYSRPGLEENCAGLDPAVVRRLGRENVSRVYKLGL